MSQTLFEKVGGFATVSRIVSAFYDSVLESERLSPYFQGMDMRRLVDHQTKFISALMGGPGSISNETLQRAHANLEINNESFDEVVSLLKMAFEDFDVDQGDISIVIREVVGRRHLIVTKAE